MNNTKIISSKVVETIGGDELPDITLKVNQEVVTPTYCAIEYSRNGSRVHVFAGDKLNATEGKACIIGPIIE